MWAAPLMEPALLVGFMFGYFPRLIKHIQPLIIQTRPTVPKTHLDKTGNILNTLLCVQRSPLYLLLPLLLWLFYLPLSRFISRDIKAEQHPSEPQTLICLCCYTALGETSSIPLSLWCVPAVKWFCRTLLTVSYSLQHV